jgi:hypothetical protein
VSDDLFDQAEEAQTTYIGGQDADDFLMAESTPSAFRKHHSIGTVIQGTILSKTVRQQTDFATKKPKFYDDGNAANQLVVIVQTNLREEIKDPDTGVVKVSEENDDGKRAFYIKGQMKAATRDAVRAAGAKGLEIGGTLAIKWDSNKPSGKGNPLKVYKVAYKAPGATAEPAPAKAAAGGTMAQIKAAAKAAKAQTTDAGQSADQDEPNF